MVTGLGRNPSLAAWRRCGNCQAAQAARELSANASRRCGSNAAIEMRAPHPKVGANGPQERAPPDQPPLNGADRISADPVTKCGPLRVDRRLARSDRALIDRRRAHVIDGKQCPRRGAAATEWARCPIAAVDVAVDLRTM